jgi:polyisoprenyl-phosphate glycosyltransferase
MKLISICIPILNEENNIRTTYDKILNFFEKKKNLQFEIIFSDNNSSDKSRETLVSLCKEDNRVKYIRYAKNIGYDRSLHVNYAHASGDAIICVDCDLQDPIEIFHKFIEKWSDGYDLVYGVRYERKGSFLFTLFTRIYYRFFNFFQNKKIPIDVGDFRLIDRSILLQINKLNLPHPYLRFLVYLLSKKSIGIDYERQLRLAGYSKFGLFNSAKYAIKMILLYSDFGRNKKFVYFFYFMTTLTLLNINFNFNYFIISLTSSLFFIFLISAIIIYFQLNNNGIIEELNLKKIIKEKINLT